MCDGSRDRGQVHAQKGLLQGGWRYSFFLRRSFERITGSGFGSWSTSWRGSSLRSACRIARSPVYGRRGEVTKLVRRIGCRIVSRSRGFSQQRVNISTRRGSLCMWTQGEMVEVLLHSAGGCGRFTGAGDVRPGDCQ